MPERIPFWRAALRYLSFQPVYFLKCDVTGCGHKLYYNYLDMSVVGTLCPQCGSNVATDADMRNFLGVPPHDPTTETEEMEERRRQIGT